MRQSLADQWFLCILLLGLAGALTFPDFFETSTGWLDPRVVVALALLLMAWTMPSRSLLSELSWPVASLWAVFISYTLVPGGAWALGKLGPIPDIGVGLLISASVPCTLASAVLWTRLAGGNEATALLTVLISTLLSWLATTGWLALVLGAVVDLPVLRVMRDLLLTLVFPVGLGQLSRAWTPLAGFANRRKVAIGIVAQMLVLCIILKAGAEVGLKLHEGSAALGIDTVGMSAFLALLLHTACLFAGLWSSRWLGLDRGRQIAVAIACSQKTLPVGLLLFKEYFQTQYPLAIVAVLFYHVGQLVLDTVIAKVLRRNANSVPVG